MTQIIVSRSNTVTFKTPLGNVTTTLQNARRFAEASGNQHELEEALQNPEIPVSVIAMTRAKGIRPRNYVV